MPLAALIALLVGAGAYRARTAEVTFYCNEARACERCNGRWARNHRTASGARPLAGVTVACNWLPFGTHISIEGFGTRTVQDRMAARFGNRVDIYVGEEPGAHKKALRLGKRKLKVKVIKP